MQGPGNHALPERDLEFVVLAAPGAGKRRLGHALCEPVIESLSLDQGLRFAGPPWDGCNAAKREARVAHEAVLDVERDCRRSQRKLVGLTVARLQINRTRPASGNAKAGDQFARGESRLYPRPLSRRLLLRGERHVSNARSAGDLNRRIERDQGLCKVAGVGGAALL